MGSRLPRLSVQEAAVKLVIIIVAVAIQTGCVSSGIPPESHARIKKIAVLPADAVVGHVEKEKQGAEDEWARSMVARNEEHESYYQKSLAGDVARFLRNKGYRVDTGLVDLAEKDDREFKLEYLNFIRDYEYASYGRASVPTASGENKINVLKSLIPISKRADADAYMFISFKKVSWDMAKLGERIFAAAFGFLINDDSSYLEIACIERGTGRILWKESMQSPMLAYTMVQGVMSSFPPIASGIEKSSSQ